MLLMKRLLRQTFMGRFDRFLCTHYPVIWRTQVHWVAIISLFTLPLSYALGQSSLLDIRMGHIPMHSTFLSLSVWLQIAAGLVLAYWIYLQLQMKLAQRSVGSLLLTFALSAVVFGLVQLHPMMLQAPMYTKLADARPDALFSAEWDLLSSHNLLVSDDPFVLQHEEEWIEDQFENLAMAYGYQKVSVSVYESWMKTDEQGDRHALTIYGQQGRNPHTHVITDELSGQLQAIHAGKLDQIGEGAYAARAAWVWQTFLPYFLLCMIGLIWISLAPVARAPQRSWLKSSTWLVFLHKWNQRTFAPKDRRYAGARAENWRVPMHYVRRYIWLPVMALFGLWSLGLLLLRPGHLIELENTEIFFLISTFGFWMTVGLAAVVGVLLIWARRPIGGNVRPLQSFFQLLKGSSATAGIALLFIISVFLLQYRIGSLRGGTQLAADSQLIMENQWVIEHDYQSQWSVRDFGSYYHTKDFGHWKVLAIAPDRPDQDRWQELAEAYDFDGVVIEALSLPAHREIACSLGNQLNDSSYCQWLRFQLSRGRSKSVTDQGLPQEVYHIQFEKGEKRYNVAHVVKQMGEIDRNHVEANRFWSSDEMPLICWFGFLLAGLISLQAHHMQLSFRMLGSQSGIAGLVALMIAGFGFILWGIASASDMPFEIGLPIAYIILLMIQIVMLADKNPPGRIGKTVLSASFMAVPIGAFLLGVYLIDHHILGTEISVQAFWATAFVGGIYTIYTFIGLRNLHWVRNWPKKR